MSRLIIILLSVFFLIAPIRTQAQEQEIAQLILNIQKLAQLKQIYDNMKKYYEILQGGYNRVKDITEGNYSLHKGFLDGLMAVSPEVRKNWKVAATIEFQLKIGTERQQANSRNRRSGLFREDELRHFERTYSGMWNQSLHITDELTMIITADKLRMNDDERLRAIERLYGKMERIYLDLKQFNTQVNLMAVQRQQIKQHAMTIKAMEGIK